MSEQSQIKALAAAQAATEATGALLTYGREGGAIEAGNRHDMLYPLVDAARLALDAQGLIEGDDGQLYAALVKWINA